VRALLPVLLASLALLAGACGGPANNESASIPPRLPATTRANVERARDAIKRFCKDIGAPEVKQAVGALINAYAAYPGRTFESGDVDERKPLRQVLADQADRLDLCGADHQALRLRTVSES